MRIGALVVAVVALAVGASLAIAAPPAGKGKQAKGETVDEVDGATKGKQSRTGEGCRPRVTVVLKGTLVGTPGETATELTLTVNGGNAHGKALLAGSLTQLTVKLDDMTNVRRNGAKTVASLAAGDRVLVQARVCKADLKAAIAPTLTAARVVAHPPSA